MILKVNKSVNVRDLKRGLLTGGKKGGKNKLTLKIQ